MTESTFEVFPFIIGIAALVFGVIYLLSPILILIRLGDIYKQTRFMHTSMITELEQIRRNTSVYPTSQSVPEVRPIALKRTSVRGTGGSRS